MLNKIKIAILSVVLLSSTWGCATIINGTTQKVGISSSPSGATVTIDDMSFGKTPAFAELKRGEEHVVKVSLSGYRTEELVITKSVSGWVWGNIVFGGLIGLAIDAVSGGLYTLSPEQINAELKTGNMSAIDDEDGLYILTVLQPNENWRKIGCLKPLEK